MAGQHTDELAIQVCYTNFCELLIRHRDSYFSGKFRMVISYPFHYLSAQL